MIERLALLPKPLRVVHVFGSNTEDKIISGCAHHNKIDATSVKLGRERRPNGWRWSTRKVFMIM
ncbi:hypothetical protein [Bartonella taylorii]|uniref:hypothetical protein n=1 Tax=Bartonella taylorii TaxID=33046 RepID=UPI001ABBCEC1|nr:hypothetical protein [Bartonella taylorii]